MHKVSCSARAAVAVTLAVAMLVSASLLGAAATPAVATVASGSLADMLGRLPNRPLGVGEEVSYADLARQAAALGIDPPQGTDDPAGRERWLAAMKTLALPTMGNDRYSAASPEWREIFGFDLFQVEQTAYFWSPPFSLTVLRGTFDLDALRAAWARAGYQPLDLGTGEAYAVREDYQVDFTDPGSRMALNALNVVAIADDGRLIVGSTRAGVQGALAVATGQAPSFADQIAIAALVRAAPQDLVSAIVVDGDLLRANPVPSPAMEAMRDKSPEDLATQVAAEQTEAQRLPQVLAVLIGHTAGGFAGRDTATPANPPAAQARLVAALAISPAAAEEAAAVIAERLATQRASDYMTYGVAGRSWAGLFPERAVRAVPGEPAVLIELVPASNASPRILVTMVLGRQPGFLAWG